SLTSSILEGLLVGRGRELGGRHPEPGPVRSAPLGELQVGTRLHVQGGGAAILVSKTWRQGDFEVFDFEVEGLHNFYVHGSGAGQFAGVLVHNSTPTTAGAQPARQLGERMTEGSAAGEAEEQYQDISSAQSKVRQGKSSQIIDDTSKSEQRADYRRGRIQTY